MPPRHAESVGAALRSSGTASGDSDVKAFVAQMNATAQKLGCTNTVYENPHGLDFDQYGGNACIPCCRPGESGCLYHDQPDVPLGGRRRVNHYHGESRRVLADVFLETDGFFDNQRGAIGVKTGFHREGRRFVREPSAKDGQELYAIVLGRRPEGSAFSMRASW